MKVLATRKDESLFQGLSRTEEISPGNFGFYATWIALAVILSVFVISALYISHIYRTNERNDIAQSAELLAETVDARLSTTSEAVSRYSFSIFHHPNWRLSTRAQGLARRLMESRPEIVEISLVKDETVLTSYASGFAFEALSLPAGQKLAMQDTLETLKRAHDSETALFSNPYFYKGNSTPYINLIVPSTNNEAIIARISLAGFMHQVTPSSLLDRASLSLKVNGKKFISTSSVAQTTEESFDILLPPLPPAVTLSVSPFNRPFLFTKDLSTLSILGLGTALLVAFLGLAGFQIRQRRTSRHLLAESVIRRAMSESIASGLRVTDMRGMIVYVNRAFRDLFRLGNKQIAGEMPPYSYWSEHERDEYLKLARDVTDGENLRRQFETTVTRPDGTTFIASIELNPLTDDSGNQIGWLEMVSDITEAKKIADELARGRERITKVLDSIDSAVSVLGKRNGETILLYTNPTYHNLWGDDPSPHQKLVSEIPNKDASSGTLTGIIHYLPEDKWFDVRERELVWTDGLTAELQIATDITERRKNEELVAQQEKKAELSSRLITMGEMVSSLAHELNQPLGAITNYASAALTLMQMGKLSESDCAQAFNKVSNQAERAAAIIKRIRLFAKRTAPEMTPTPVQKLIDETMELALIQAKKRDATVKLDISPEVSSVVCDAVMIEQLLLNLLKNAMEAAEPCENHEITLTVKPLEAEHQVAFEISDHGPGIPADVKAKLFEPFFSTKAEGMGIGLNICRSIAEMHQGRLRVEDNPGGGTIFILTLPAYTEGAAFQA